MAAIRKGTTFLSLVSGAWTIARVTAQPLQRFRLDAQSTMADVARAFALFTDAVEDATIATRSLPFGGPAAFFEDVVFTFGSDLTVPNVTKSTKIIPFLSAVKSTTAGNAYLVGWGLNHDATQIILTPGGSFIASVLVMVTP